MIKRLFTFDAEDWRHLGYLIGYWITGVVIGDKSLEKESAALMKLHLNYDHKRIK